MSVTYYPYLHNFEAECKKRDLRVLTRVGKRPPTSISYYAMDGFSRLGRFIDLDEPGQSHGFICDTSLEYLRETGWN